MTLLPPQISPLEFHLNIFFDLMKENKEYAFFL